MKQISKQSDISKYFILLLCWHRVSLIGGSFWGYFVVRTVSEYIYTW